jgi:hypothetical protein
LCRLALASATRRECHCTPMGSPRFRCLPGLG